MANKKILLGLTTFMSDWRAKIKEASSLLIGEAALFLTDVLPDQRKELYALLEQSSIKSLPHVHLRTDMELAEIEYLIEKFDTRVFNIHPQSKHASPEYFKKYSSVIFVENLLIIPSIHEIEQWAGLCVDFSHWEGGLLGQWPGYDKFGELVEKYKIGCAHVSAVSSEPNSFGGVADCSNHHFRDLGEFDYMRKYVEYLPEFISLELTNSFGEQLKAKEYLEKIIL